MKKVKGEKSEALQSWQTVLDRPTIGLNHCPVGKTPSKGGVPAGREGYLGGSVKTGARRGPGGDKRESTGQRKKKNVRGWRGTASGGKPIARVPGNEPVQPKKSASEGDKNWSMICAEGSKILSIGAPPQGVKKWKIDSWARKNGGGGKESPCPKVSKKAPSQGGHNRRRNNDQHWARRRWRRRKAIKRKETPYANRGK